MGYKNIEDKKTYNKKYYQEHRKKILKDTKRYKEENPEYYKEYIKKWRERNPEYGKVHHLVNRGKELEQVKKWRENNLEYRKRYKKEYYETEKGKATNQRNQCTRRAREKKIINTLTAQEWIDILKRYKFRCAYCDCEFTLFNRETRDHIIPISKNGDNIRENIVPACQSCNSKKNNKSIDEFKEVI